MASQPWDYIAKIVSLGDSGTGKSSLTIRLCEGRFTAQHDVTIGVEFGSRIVPVGPPASLSLGINNPGAGAGVGVSTTSPAAAASTTATKSKKDGKNQTQQQSKDDQKHMKLSLWDTAGQETYKSITRSYFRGASGALLVFDITRRNTFDSVTQWLSDLRAIAEEGIVVVLVGNKTDLASEGERGEAVGDANAATASKGTGDGRESRNKRAVSLEEAENWCRHNGVMRYVETSAKSGEGVERAFLEVAERIYQNIEAGKYDLNDRRSGVKSAAMGGVQGGAGARTVNLVKKDKVAAKKSGCC